MALEIDGMRVTAKLTHGERNIINRLLSSNHDGPGKDARIREVIRTAEARNHNGHKAKVASHKSTPNRVSVAHCQWRS